jgi:hypothetical protein
MGRRWQQDGRGDGGDVLPVRSGGEPKFQAKKSHSLSGFFFVFGAGNETRTRDPDLGKVVLYQLSYSRVLVVRIL